jgi:hypothetical protein
MNYFEGNNSNEIMAPLSVQIFMNSSWRQSMNTALLRGMLSAYSFPVKTFLAVLELE